MDIVSINPFPSFFFLLRIPNPYEEKKKTIHVFSTNACLYSPY